MVQEKKEGFTLLSECLAAETILVQKYQSSRTGLTVIVATVPGPLVYGSFFIATEAMDDDGLPHTLEHLIFLGSDGYPYKGTLDIAASRCLADGTNAWTDTDHTAYTVSTAGSEGFLNLLPIYLDHIFFPTLTDAGFTTEVYHITGEGKDSGVVFCEMQGMESSDSYQTSLELQRALYKPNCGYRYETGGAVHNLRYSTSNEKVRKFHEQFYCPLNTSIVVAGSVDVDKLLKTCYEFEEKLIKKGSNAYKKAWQSPVEPLERPTIRAITFQTDKEDNGCVEIGWQGPSLVDKFYQVVACTILLNYLTETSASPLMKYFVEISDPYCSEILVKVVENSIVALVIEFENVVIDKMPFIHEKLMGLLQIIVDNKDESYRITKDRMNSVIEKYALQKLLEFEEDPHNTVALTLIRDTLYGTSTENLIEKLDIRKLASRLLNEPISFWISLLNDYFLQRPSATVLGYPWKNQEILQTLLEDERLARRKAILGKEGLKEKATVLEKAIERNEVSPPDELIATVPVPSIDNLKYHSVNRYTTSSKEQHRDFDVSLSPVFTHLDDLDSKFVYAYVVMDCRKLPRKLHLYMSLFLEYVLSCPVTRNGEIISHEEVAAELERDVISITSCIGLFSEEKFTSGEFSDSVLLSLAMTEENFEKGINWIRSLLYDSVFTHERVLVTVQRVMNSISQIRRQGYTMVKCLSKLMLFNSDNHRMNTILSQQDFLSSLIKKLENEREREAVIKDLEELRSILTSSENMILHLSTNVKQLVKKCRNPAEILSRILPENAVPNQKRFEIQQDFKFLSTTILNQDDQIKSCVVGMATEDASFMQHATKSIYDFEHPDLPALLVCTHYLTQLEGPLWRNIRGYGLAYSYKIISKPNEGTLVLMLYRSSDIVKAFSRTKEVVLDIIDSDNWSQSLFESGKGSLVFQIVNLEKNIASASRRSLLSHFYNIPADYHRKLIQKIRDVSLSEMKKVAGKYLLPLFDPKKSLSTIVCHTSKYEHVSKCFAEMGHELVAFPSLEESYFKPSFVRSLL